MKRCYSCFMEYDEQFSVCPHCGQPEITTPKEVIHLAPGTVLANRYILGRAVGAGGFGIVYRAWDSKLETIVAVKEFYVNRLVTRAPGLKNLIVSKKAQDEFDYRKERFLVEAKNMARFASHRSIPHVFEYFEENNTAYLVMELLHGEPLNEFMKNCGGKVDRDFAVYIATEVGQALKALHDAGIIHRDIAPDNIYVCSGSEIRIKVMDLGAAKLADSSDDVIDIILKPGYSPTEQYDNSKNIGPWTDIYALGATLYAMLTGVKPDESTNRKINDTVLPPHEIDPEIPENLSNAVMKAMALDRHMRFKNGDEFVAAINGQKKVFTLAEERRKRKIKQLAGILAAVVVLAIGGIMLLRSYENMEEEENLPPSTISVWYSAEAGSSEERAMDYMIQAFNKTYPHVTVELVRQNPNSYEKALEEAAANNSLPSVFESTGVSEDIISSATDVSKLLETPQALNCLFLPTQYDNYYDEKKIIPIGFEVPVAIVITGGEISVNYSFKTFSDIGDFWDTNVAFDSSKKDFLSKSFELTKYDENDFIGDNATCAVLITTTENVQNYESYLMSNEWHTAYCNSEVYGRFDYEWCIGNNSSDEEIAAEKLLIWMMGNVYQNTLMISMAQDGQFPLNETCFNEKVGLSADFAGIVDAKDNIIFKK